MKNIRYTLLFLMLLQILGPLSAQGWIKVYDQPGADFIDYRITAASVAPDGSIVLFGTNNDQKYFLAKADSKGNILWRKAMPGIYSEIRTEIHFRPNGQFALLVFVDGNNSADDSSITLFEANGDILWQKEFKMNSRFQLLDDHIIVAEKTDNQYLNWRFPIVC